MVQNAFNLYSLRLDAGAGIMRWMTPSDPSDGSDAVVACSGIHDRHRVSLRVLDPRAGRRTEWGCGSPPRAVVADTAAPAWGQVLLHGPGRRQVLLDGL